MPHFRDLDEIGAAGVTPPKHWTTSAALPPVVAALLALVLWMSTRGGLRSGWYGDWSGAWGVLLLVAWSGYCVVYAAKLALLSFLEWPRNVWLVALVSVFSSAILASILVGFFWH